MYVCTYLVRHETAFGCNTSAVAMTTAKVTRTMWSVHTIVWPSYTLSVSSLAHSYIYKPLHVWNTYTNWINYDIINTIKGTGTHNGTAVGVGCMLLPFFCGAFCSAPGWSQTRTCLAFPFVVDIPRGWSLLIGKDRMLALMQLCYQATDKAVPPSSHTPIGITLGPRPGPGTVVGGSMYRVSRRSLESM